MTTAHTIVVRGGPLNDHDEAAEREVQVEGDELLDRYVAIPGANHHGELVEPPMDPPPSIKTYRRNGSIWVWG